MRDQVLTYLGNKDFGTYTLSVQLPYDTGVPLYLKNVKSIYVDLDQYTTEVFIGILGQQSIDMEITSVTVYFSNDAKNLPSDYSTVVDTIRSAQTLYAANGFFKRNVELKTEFEKDLMTTIVVLQFYKLI